MTENYQSQYYKRKKAAIDVGAQVGGAVKLHVGGHTCTTCMCQKNDHLHVSVQKSLLFGQTD